MWTVGDILKTITGNLEKINITIYADSGFLVFFKNNIWQEAGLSCNAIVCSSANY